MTLDIYSHVNQLLADRERLVLARIIHRTGSTPREKGAMCIITKDRIIGTVGGGALEHQVAEKARQMLDSPQSFIYQFRLSATDVAGTDMICGGDVDLFLEPVLPENETKVSVFRAAADALSRSLPGTLITRIENGLPGMDTGTNAFLGTDGTAAGHITGVDLKQAFPLSDPEPGGSAPFELKTLPGSNTRLFVERMVPPPTVVLFGAGHVSRFVAQIAAMVGFRVIVIDDRSEFANRDRFPDADECRVCDFETAFESLTITSSTYILIITRGHLHDKQVLEQSLSTPAGYIGMIGSKKKRDLIYKDLLERGISREKIEQVHCPVGLPINARTPEEIAVSIVGELIQKRAPEKKPRLA